MKRVLLVCPNFAPASGADMHRVRLCAPHLQQFGWQPEILAIDPEAAVGAIDPWLIERFPQDIPVHRVAAGNAWLRNMPGFGGVSQRSLIPMGVRGSELIRDGAFDLVYFSTTMFELNLLGPFWNERHGTPFVTDFQDAWVSDYYERSGVKPPGGRIKYALASALARRLEPWVLGRCAGITAVSATYSEEIQARYGLGLPSVVLPFPGAARDLVTLPGDPVSPFASDGSINWVYVGRGGEDMSKAVSALFRAIRQSASDELLSRLKLHFIGTSYSPTGLPTLAPLAEEFGLSDLVSEVPSRIPYSLTMAWLKNADALLVPGSDDPAYTASKIYPYLLANRPLLAIFHQQSSVVRLVSEVGGAKIVTFGSDDDVAAIADQIGSVWLKDDAWRETTPLDEIAFQPYSDVGSARLLANFFDVCTGASA